MNKFVLFIGILIISFLSNAFAKRLANNECLQNILNYDLFNLGERK